MSSPSLSAAALAAHARSVAAASGLHGVLRLRLVIEAEDGSIEIVVHARDLAQVEVRAAPPPPDCRPFSPTEASLVGVLDLAGDWLRSEEAAHRAGAKYDTAFKAMVTSLAEAGVIENSTRHGIRLCRKEPPGSPAA